ncbi:hypothetical protein EXIGLDRAFT_779856 [Exidia glandulosa HHB12029]|uniref:RGS domain-containing protein n=1 Tax=Exidia glandulosa HHB12029 TaxID=1314781 RepID=A0A165BVT7_EXIGL|nr:hypothetical protein EXIGLDRAFT_779856 [Exidia glandulosa HHB12029]
MPNTVLPSYTRPSKFTYRLGQLKHFPKRLVCPCDAGVGTVRSFKITPKFDVKLDDVLNARHLPPLGLKEFEEYLLFVEHSAENLYFWFWLKKYEETYSRLGSNGEMENRHDIERELRESYACARATFLVQGAPLELNLSADTLDVLPETPIPADDKEAPVQPAEFAAARQQVTDMLQHSLHAFVGAHSRNAGRNRGLFAIVVGLIVCAVGLAPILLSFYRHGRFVAFAALPCLWLGVGTLVAGLHGVCVVIFLFGDARQLHPFELVSPSESDIMQARSIRSRRGSAAKGDKERIHFNGARRSDSSSIEEKSSKPTLTKASPRVVDLGLPAEPSSHSDHSIIAPFLAGPDAVPFPQSPSNSSGFDWAISSSSSSMIAKRGRAGENIRSIWAPMAEVMSPIVRRGQWEIVIRSFIVGLVVALVVCGICAAPYSGRRRG